MEKPTQTEAAENKPEKTTQTEADENKPKNVTQTLLVTKNIIEIRHNLVFPRNLDYVPSFHEIQPMPHFSFYRPGYWPGPPNLPRYLRFREFQNNNNNSFEEFI